MTLKTSWDSIHHWIISALSWYVTPLCLKDYKSIKLEENNGNPFSRSCIWGEKQVNFTSVHSSVLTCTCAITDLSFKGEVSFQNSFIWPFFFPFFFLNDLFSDTPAFFPQVKFWKFIRVLTLDESFIVVEEIILNFSESVKLLRIYKIFRQTTQAIDTGILYFSTVPNAWCQ